MQPLEIVLVILSYCSFFFAWIECNHDMEDYHVAEYEKNHYIAVFLICEPVEREFVLNSRELVSLSLLLVI
jgi:uncharacterized CHY-type Zn-finger protein